MTDTSRPSRHDAHAAARKVFVKAALDEYATRQLPAPPDLWPAIRQRAARSRPRPAPRRALPWSPVGLPRPPHTRPEPERAARGPRHAFLVSANLLVTGALNEDDDLTVRIIDTRSGAERVRFRPPVPIEMSYLTADGSRLFGWGPAYSDKPTQYFLWDTADGRLLATLGPLPLCCGPVYAPDGRRVYGMQTVEPASKRPLPSPALVAYELPVGREVGRLPLDLGQALSGNPPSSPGIAVSADGRRIALVHPDGDRLTLIDTARWQVLSTRPLSPPPGATGGPVPSAAAAPLAASRSTSWHVIFSPDGRHLYASGTETWWTSLGNDRFQLTVQRSLGSSVIDVSRAAIVAAVAGERSERLWAAPDGTMYSYSYGERTDAAQPPAQVLRRRDPLTLAVTAERQFAREAWLVFLPPATP